MKRRSLEVWRSPLHRATVWHLESRGTQKVIGSCVRTHTPVARAAKIDAFWTARKAGQLALRNIIRCHGEARPRASRHDWMAAGGCCGAVDDVHLGVLGMGYDHQGVRPGGRCRRGLEGLQ